MCEQCDQIWQCYKHLCCKFYYKSSPNIWLLLGLFWKIFLLSKNYCWVFLENFWRNLAVFWFFINITLTTWAEILALKNSMTYHCLGNLSQPSMPMCNISFLFSNVILLIFFYICTYLSWFQYLPRLHAASKICCRHFHHHQDDDDDHRAWRPKLTITENWNNRGHFQCDQIWQYLQSLGHFWGFISYLGNFWIEFGKFSMMQMAKCWKFI